MKGRSLRRYLLAGLLGIAAHWLIVYMAFIALRLNAGQPLTGFFPAVYDRLAQAGDIPHYVHIAAYGYERAGEYANEIVFFPLYPLLMRAAHCVIPDYVVSGAAVSNLFLGVASGALLALMDRELGEKRAMKGLLLFTLFPVGFFMAGAYTESLFIALVALDMLALAERRWGWAGALGCLAALTRSQGVALLVPAVYEACLDLRAGKRRRTMPLVLLIPLGTAAYLGLNLALFGSPTAFLGFQAAAPWYNTSHWIADNLAQHYYMALDYPYLATFIYWAQLGLYFTGLALLFRGLGRGVRPSFVALGGAYMFMTYLHGWMISGPRYMMGCVPLYLALAASGREEGEAALAAPIAVLAVAFAMWYLQGQAIM